MRHLRITLFALTLLLVTLCAAIAANAPFFFVHITDPQLGFTTSNKDMVAEIEHFTKAVEHINRLKPAFVLITGDLTNAKRDPKQVREFYRIAGQINPDIPVRMLPGNHDVGNAPTATDIRGYRKIFGDDYYSFSYNGAQFVAINACLLCNGADEGYRDEQRKWLVGALEAARASRPTHIFMCMHQPFFLNKADEPDRYQNIPLAQRTEYLHLTNRYGVDYAISGHLHHEQSADHGGMKLVTSGALSKSEGDPPDVGLRIWKVYPERVEHEFYTLGKVPQAVKL